MMNIFHTIQEDLHKVQLMVQKSFKIKAGYVNEFVLPGLDYLDHYLRPGLVIYSQKLFGPVTQQAIALATVLQYIFLASQVHLKVVEGSCEKNAREKYQYPVLVGDYLYSKAFTILYDADLYRYQEQLAQLICTINKGGILREVNKDIDIVSTRRCNDIVRLEVAELLACCAYLGADLGDADHNIKDKLYHLGLNIGMAHGLQNIGATAEQIQPYLSLAEGTLTQFPHSCETSCLKNLLFFLGQDKQMQRMVV